MKLYMKVTSDKFELPLCVAETIRELALKTGHPETSIRSILSRNRTGSCVCNSCFKEVELLFDYDKFRAMYEELEEKHEFMNYIYASKSAVENWLKNVGDPKYMQVLSMARYFGVDEDYFLKIED